MRAAEHYREECQIRQCENTPYVMQAATFYGPKEPWREYLDPPKVAPSTNGAKSHAWLDQLR